MTIQERILEVIDYKGITPYRFCKDLNLSMGYLDKRGSIGTDKYLKIIEYLDEINPMWLLTGEGTKYKSEQAPTQVAPVQNNDKYVTLLEEKLEDKQKQITLLEENKALLQAENERLKAEIQALKSVQGMRVNQSSQPSQTKPFVQPQR